MGHNNEWGKVSENEVLDQRIQELETRVAFQEDTLQQLNQVVSQQDGIILRYRSNCAFAEKVNDLEYGLEQGATKASHERPHTINTLLCYRVVTSYCLLV